MRKNETLQRHRIQRFVKTPIEMRKKPEHRPEPLPTTRLQSTNGHARPVPVKKDLPLFMEPLFRAKDYDPL